MIVCRTCLIELSNNRFYSADHILEENCEINNDSNTMKLRKMIEKCVPEMDLDICDSPVICEDCCELLQRAFKFRNICVQTEEKVYQYIEKNNLRLGESIDLNNLAVKHSSQEDIILIEKTELKKEDDVSIELEDMPLLLPEIDVTRESRERQLIIKLNRISHGVLKNLESEHNRIKKNIADSRESENTNAAESKYEKKFYTCEDCQYKASTWAYLKNHVMLKQCAKRHKCDECSYSTFRITHFKRHKLTHTGQKPFECEVCQKGYLDKWRLRGHMLEHKSVEDLPFKCQEDGCQYASSKKFELRIHMVRHIKGYPYFCKVCKTLSFTSKTELREHELNCAQRKQTGSNQCSHFNID